MQWRCGVWVLVVWASVTVASGDGAGRNVSTVSVDDWYGVEHEVGRWSRAPNASVRVWWRSDAREVTFRVEAPTKGLVGVGLLRPGRHNKKMSDIIVGWVKDGEATIQDRYETSKREFRLDRKQNVELVAGFENKTHTTLIFKRKHETCDREEDVAITNDTTRMFYLMHVDDPDNPSKAINGGQHMSKGFASVLIAPRPPSVSQLSPHWLMSADLDVSEDDNVGYTNRLSRQQLVYWDLINYKVLVPRDEETLYLCKVFQLPPNITVKHHVIGFEPIIQAGNEELVHHIFVYSCHPSNTDEEEQLDELSTLKGDKCHKYDSPQVLKSCHTLFLVWTIGSKGLLFPENVGLLLDPDLGPRHLYVEVRYDNSNLKSEIKDNSGVRLWCSGALRPMEAGVMSIGMEPNWKHIIPPLQSSVVTSGHCIGQCTKEAFPPSGIHVFGSILYTHSLGRRISLRHIRNDTELAPIVEDNYYDSKYQESHLLFEAQSILPGDHLIAECTYNSKGRQSMVVGGLSSREEKCLVYIYYYPKVKMSICQSIHNATTVYASMGVKQLWEDRMPPMIKKPAAYANHTLAEHIANYDWTKNIELYKSVFRTAAFYARCGNVSHQLHLADVGQQRSPNFYPSINAVYERPKLCPKVNPTKDFSTPTRVNPTTTDRPMSSRSSSGPTKGTRRPLKTTQKVPSSGIRIKMNLMTFFYWFILMGCFNQIVHYRNS